MRKRLRNGRIVELETMSQSQLDNVIAVHGRWLAGNREGRRANLDYCDLRGLDFRNADLRYASMRDCELAGADFTGADIWDADTHDVDMTQVIGLDAPWVVPREGAFVGWKLCGGYHLAKLLIPEDAQRLNGASRKCRASKAFVLAIYDRDGHEVREAPSWWHSAATFRYRAGEFVEPEEPFDECRFHEGASGIHFFMTCEEVKLYTGARFDLPPSAFEGVEDCGGCSLEEKRRDANPD